MKSFILTLLLTLSSIVNAQFVNYGSDGSRFPQLSENIDPLLKIGVIDKYFVYDDEVMENVMLTIERYENGEIEHKEIIKLSDQEWYDKMDEFYFVTNNSPNFLAARKQATKNIKVDSLNYDPSENETFYSSGKEYLLGYTDDDTATLHAIYFLNNNKIIGKSSLKEFTRIEYDDKGQMIDNYTYRGIEVISDNIDEATIEFYADPMEYIHTKYDKMDRIKKQWVSVNESWIIGDSYSEEYDSSYFTYFIEYSYNNSNQVTSTKQTNYELLPNWKKKNETIATNSKTGSFHPNPDDLDQLAYGKKESSTYYTYNKHGQITNLRENKVEWKRDGNSLIESSKYKHRIESFAYYPDKIIEEYYIHEPDAIEWNEKTDRFYKTIYHLDKKGKLIKKENFKKSNKSNPYLIVERETLEFENK